MFAYCSICGAIDPTVTFKSAGFKASPAIPPECLWRRVYNRSGSFGTIRRMRISEALNSRIYINMFIFGSKYIQVYLRRREKVAHLWQQWPAVRTLKALIKNVGFAQICKFATKRNLSCLWICKNLRIYGYCVLCTFFAVISVPPHPLALKANHRELVYCSENVNIEKRKCQYWKMKITNFKIFDIWVWSMRQS